MPLADPANGPHTLEGVHRECPGLVPADAYRGRSMQAVAGAFELVEQSRRRMRSSERLMSGSPVR